MEQVVIDSEDINLLVARIVSLVEKNSGKRVIVSVAGAPGSGKSFLSAKVARALNDKAINTIVVPQDGYHLSRLQLQSLPNPEEAFARRGAPFTFDSQQFLQLIVKLRENGEETLLAPSFDHKLKDPLENSIAIPHDMAVVIVEGNYVSLNNLYWNKIFNYVDDSWFIDVPLETIKVRIVNRHLEAGIAKTKQEAIDRVENNDLVNARYILDNSKKTNVRIVTKPI